MITRRNVILSLGAGAVIAPFAAFAQRQQMARVGILASGSKSASANLYGAFVQALKDLGHVEGSTIAFESRYANGDLDRLPALAAELIKRNVDILFAPNSPYRAARQAAVTTPIVFAVVNDPVERGFVANLARPGGNITGVASIAPGLNIQRLQMLKEVSPKIPTSRSPSPASRMPRAGYRPDHLAGSARQKPTAWICCRSRFAAATRSLSASEILRKWGVDSLSCLDSAGIFYTRNVLIEFAASMKLPAVYPSSEYVDAGGLMSYGANTEWNYRHAALYVDKILKGEKPGGLAVEAPTRLELVLNRKVAKELGLYFPRHCCKRRTASSADLP